MTSGLVTRLLRGGAGSSFPYAVLLIDGRSGSGKTTLAEQVAREVAQVTGSAPQIISMDELYPGWDGLAEGSASLANVFRTGRYRRFDWEVGEFRQEIVLGSVFDPALESTRMLIVEGCGSITAASINAARARGNVYRVWAECPEELRRTRALERDGDMFAPHWNRWAAQDKVHFASARPLALANEVIHVA